MIVLVLMEAVVWLGRRSTIFKRKEGKNIQVFSSQIAFLQEDPYSRDKQM